MLTAQATEDDPRFIAYVHAWAECCDGYIRPGDVVHIKHGITVHAACEPVEGE